MKKCGNCGKDIDSGMRFCPYCGTPQSEEVPKAEAKKPEAEQTKAEVKEEAKTEVKAEAKAEPKAEPKAEAKAEPKPKPTPKPASAPKSTPTPTPAKSNGNGKKTIPIIAAAAVVIIAVLVFLLMPKNMEIVPTDYVRVSVKGLDGEGKAELEFDTSSFIAAIMAEKELTPAQESAIEGLLQHAEDYFQFSSGTGLSNGDEVTISCTMPEKYLSDYKVKLVDETFTYTVAGLIDMQIVKLSDYFNVSFYGFDGKGYANYYLDTDAIYSVVVQMVRNVDTSESAETYIRDHAYSDIYNSFTTMNIDKTDGLSNGDKVTASCPVVTGYDRVAKYGIIFESEDVEFEVTGLEAIDTLSAQDYMKVEFTGYDTVGYLDINVDFEKLTADMEEKYPDGRNGYTSEDMAYYIEDFLYYSFYFNADRTEGLANGETVQISAEYDGGQEEPYISSIGIIMQGGQSTVTVENLAEPQEADLMDAITVTFSGVCPRVEVDVNIDYDNPLSSYISSDSYYNIPDYVIAKNGDTLDITLEYDEIYALKNGYKIVNNQKTYEISGLDTYEYTLADVNDARLQESIQMARQEIAYAAISEESTILKNVSGGSGIVLWDQVTVDLNEIVRFNLDSTYNAYNRTHYIYEISVPVLYQGGAVSNHTIYASYHFDNAVETVNGELTVNDGRYNYFFYSMEELETALSEAPSNMGAKEDTNIVRNDWVNEALEALVPAEAEEIAEAAVEAASVQVEAKEIPEISQDIASQATAMVEYNGHRYYRFDTAMTWQQAYDFCNSCNMAQAHMATVSGYTEQAVLRKLINDGGCDGYWLGMTDEDMEGQWVWVTGEEFTYDGWDNGQPDNASAAEHWAYISKSYSGNWNDNTSDRNNIGFILEVEAEETNLDAVVVADSDLLKSASGTDIDDWVLDTYGNCYYATRCYDTSEKGRASYALNGEYSRLTGITSVYEKAASGVSMNFAIFGDGKLLYKQTAITRESKAQYIDVDVRGVDVLTITTSNWGETSEDWLLFSDVTLYPAETVQESNVKRLDDMFWVDSYEITSESTLWQDVYGEWSDTRARFYARAKSFIILNLDEEYSTFDGTFTMGSKTTARTSMGVEIYGDGELLFSADGLNKMSGAVDFSVDVTGVKSLKIMTFDAMEAYDSYLYLVNTAFTEAEEETEAVALGKPEGTALALSKPVQMDESVLGLVSAKAEYGDHKYYLFETTVLWEQARQFCENAGGHLAVITSPQEQRRIEKLLGNAAANEYWIGGTDLSDNDWVWVTGEPMEYTYWSSGQPDNYNGVEDYLSIYKDGKWNDNDPEEVLGFILEISPDTSATYGTSKELAALESILTGSNAYEYWKTAYDWQGNEYLSSYYMRANDDAWASYELNGEYISISGTLSSCSESYAAADMYFGIFGDGVLLYEKGQMSGDQRAEKFTVDVTGVKTLTIRARSLNDERGRLLLNDVELAVAAEATVGEVPGRLVNLQLVNSSAMKNYNRMFIDTYGNGYDGDIRFETNSNASAVYLLGGQYESFTCYLTAGPGTKTGSVMNAEIYGDDQLLFTQDGITKETGPVLVELDVTGISNLKVVTSRSSDNYDAYLYLVGDLLK